MAQVMETNKKYIDFALFAIHKPELQMKVTCQCSYSVKSDVSKVFQNNCYMFEIVTYLLWKHIM